MIVTSCSRERRSTRRQEEILSPRSGGYGTRWERKRAFKAGEEYPAEPAGSATLQDETAPDPAGAAVRDLEPDLSEGLCDDLFTAGVEA